VLADLQHVYNSVLRTYKPVVAALDAAGPSTRASLAAAKQAVAAAGLRLAHLATHAQMLRDTKYFVKDYGGPFGVAPPPGVVRLVVAVRLPADMEPAWAAVAGRAPRTRKLDTTPGEVVLLPPDKAAVADLKKAAGEAMAEVYRMFKPYGSGKEFRVAAVESGLAPHPHAHVHHHAHHHGSRGCDKGDKDKQQQQQGEGCSQGVEHDALRLVPAGAGGAAGGKGGKAQAAAAGTRAVADGAVLVVSGSGMDGDRRWRHAGGPEDWQVCCDVCGTQDDDGERMIACDGCTVWQHTRCCGIRDDQQEPAHFVCELCAEAAGAGKHAPASGRK